MKTLYTIGFIQKKAEVFFSILQENNIKTLIDIRESNSNIYAGYTVKDNLIYFLKVICNINYIENNHFAPTKELRNQYKKDKNWSEYEQNYLLLLNQRKARIDAKLIDKAVLLCSEPTPDFCHRRLAAEYIANHYKNVRVIHL